MKKFNITLILSTALFALPVATVHAGALPTTDGDGKYWTFWQKLQESNALKIKQNREALSETIQSSLGAQNQFKSSCKKSNDQRCRDFLETLLNAEQAILTANKKMAQRGKKDLRKALRDLKKL
tara:strand:- start:300 stop:671 length:372 start_codon:yes stop_codon:yes gene_type:complete